MDLRSYSRDKATYDQECKTVPELSKRTSSPGIERVRAMIFGLAKERMQERK